MPLLEIVGGTVIKATHDLGKYIVVNIFKEENEGLVNKVNKAIDAAIALFFDKFGDQFGKPSSCFLERQKNWDIIVGSCFYGQKSLTYGDIDPRGFDEVPNASQEAIGFFVDSLKVEMSASWEIDKILQEKDFYNKTEEKLDSISEQIATTQIELKEALLIFADDVTSSKITDQERLTQIAKEMTQVSKNVSSAIDISTNLVTTEYQAELEYAKGLIDKNKPLEAISFLGQIRERIWRQAQSDVKFKLLTTTAAAHINVANYKLAGPLLIEALQYQPRDEKAIHNAGFGYLILNMTHKAIEKANEVLTLNPTNSGAYSILIQATPLSTSLETVIAIIPEFLKRSTEVANALGIFCQKQGNEIEAEKWFGIAVDTNKEHGPDLIASLGSIILESVANDQTFLVGKQLDEIKKRRLEKGIELLSQAWEQVGNTELRTAKVKWVYNRSLGHRMLGNVDDAIADIEVALSIEPENTEYRKQQAILALQKKEWPKAISILDRIPFDLNYPEIPIILAQSLANNGELTRAISVLKEYLEIKSIATEIANEAQRLLMHIYLDMGNLDLAKEAFNSLKAESEMSDIGVMIDSAILEKKLTSENAQAIAILKNAVQLISETTPYCDIHRLADELYSLEEYYVAAQIYGKITNTSSDSLILRRYLVALYKAGKSAEALKICRNIMSDKGNEKYYVEFESVILQETGNLLGAKAVCDKYLAENSTDLEIKIRLATINLKARNFELVDAFLNSHIEISLLPTELAVLLPQIYSARDMNHRALELSYELRRIIRTGEIHSLYIHIFFRSSAQNDGWLEANEVAENTAVIVESENGRRETYLIEDRPDAILERGEISPSSNLAQRLLGKKVADLVLIKDGPVVKIYGRIMEIKSKFVHAFHESLAFTESDLIDIPGWHSVPIGKPEKPGGLPAGLEAIIRIPHERKAFINSVEDAYRDGKITIGTFARLIDRSVIDVWGSIANREDIGIKASISFAPIKINQSKVVIDVISILTIHGLNIQEQIAKYLGSISVGQSTVDLLSNKLVELKAFGARGFLTIGRSEDNYVKEEVSTDLVTKTIEHYENILAWLDKYGRVMPCNAVLNMDRYQKSQLDDKFGKSFVESILIASETDSLLFSDDLTLRLIAKGVFNVEGLWTQQILAANLAEGCLDRSTYNEAIVRLIISNYQYPSIDASILLHSVKVDGILNLQRLDKVSRLLGGKYCEANSAIQVAVQFLYELSKQADLTLRYYAIIQMLITNLVDNRDSRSTLKSMVSAIQAHFILLPIAEKRIIEMIELWQKSHYVDF